MNTRRTHFHRVARLALGALLAATTVPAADLTGTYESTGTIVSSGNAKVGSEVSFRGLLALEFDHALARLAHSPTTRVVITQADGGLRIVCHDEDGRETWRGQWDRGVGYDFDREKVRLLFRAPRFGDDAFLFILKPIENPDLLSVEVQHLHSTTLGPSLKPIGTFVFSRIADRSTAVETPAGK